MTYRRAIAELTLAVAVAAVTTTALLVPVFDAYTENPPIGDYMVGFMGRLIGQPIGTRVIITAIAFGLIAAGCVVGGLRFLRWKPKYTPEADRF